MSKKQTVVVMCGGASMEHEVSIITGLQVFEQLCDPAFEKYFVFVDRENNLFWLKNLKTKKDFFSSKRIPITITRLAGKPVMQTLSGWQRRIPLGVAYTAFHGGSGESGPVQGLLAMAGLAKTSASVEGSVIAMNKVLTKEVLAHAQVPQLPWERVNAAAFTSDPKSVLTRVTSRFTFPVIVKPAHLGSSIGIKIANTDVELEKALFTATQIDTEVLIEPALINFTEYNIALRQRSNVLELSPIEEPVREDSILSFADKYDNGAKKSGGGGMELLDRSLPADISEVLANQIKEYATAAYRAARLSGTLRIDFMYADEQLYCTEINPIPGSMAFYLWEANGEQFFDQITGDLTEAMQAAAVAKPLPSYDTDIVEKFIAA